MDAAQVLLPLPRSVFQQSVSKQAPGKTGPGFVQYLQAAVWEGAGGSPGAQWVLWTGTEQGPPPASSHSGGPPCPSPSSSCPGDPNTALHVGQGGLGEVVLVLSIFFCSAPNVRWKTPPCPTPAASRTTKSSAEHPKSRLKQAGVPKAPRSIIIVNNVPLICKQRKARRCSSIYLHS